MNCESSPMNGCASTRETGCKECRARKGMGIAERLFE